jgi:hypothetical protein
MHNLQLLALSPEEPSDFFVGLETASKAHLLARAAGYGLLCAGNSADIRNILTDHFLSGECNNQDKMFACQNIQKAVDPDVIIPDDLQVYLLAATAYNIPQKHLTKLLEMRGVQFDHHAGLGKLHRLL